MSEDFGVGVEFVLQLAELTFKVREVGQRQQRLMHAVGRALHHRAAGPPKDPIAPHENFDRRFGRGNVGLGHPLLAALLFVESGG